MFGSTVGASEHVCDRVCGARGGGGGGGVMPDTPRAFETAVLFNKNIPAALKAVFANVMTCATPATFLTPLLVSRLFSPFFLFPNPYILVIQVVGFRLTSSKNMISS